MPDIITDPDNKDAVDPAGAAPKVDPSGNEAPATSEADTQQANPDTGAPDVLNEDTSVDPHADVLPRGAQNADIVAAKHQLSQEAADNAGLPPVDPETGEPVDDDDDDDDTVDPDDDEDADDDELDLDGDDDEDDSE